MGCVPEHCSLCFPCYLQNPPLSTGRERKRVFIWAQAPWDNTLQEPEPRRTQWLIEQSSPSACSPHVTPEPSDPPKFAGGRRRPEQQRPRVQPKPLRAGPRRPVDSRTRGTWTLTCFFLPKSQQLETMTASFPSCEMRGALFLTAAHRRNLGRGRGWTCRCCGAALICRGRRTVRGSRRLVLGS